MLPVDLQQVFIGPRPGAGGAVGIPVFVGMEPATSDPVWALSFRPKEFVVVAERQVWRLPPTAAPFLANAWSRLAVTSYDAKVLQYFDRQAGVLPFSFTDFSATSLLTTHLLRQTGYDPVTPALDALQAYATLDDSTYVAATMVVAQMHTLYREAVLRPYAMYVDQWLQARQLLDLMSARGYVVPDVLAAVRSDVDGLLHPQWALPIVPGRITTAQPPLHALKRTLRDQLQARPGARWVLVTWPEIVSALASLATYGVKRMPAPGEDWALGRHDVEAPDVVPMDVVDLRRDWVARKRSYPIPTPSQNGVEITAGRMALEAVSAFTVSQLATLFQSWRRDEPVLLGLSDVMPYLGTIAFQIDDRVPLHLLTEYFQHLHAFHVPPVLLVGQTRGAMYPIDGPLTPVALDLDKPAVWPVECPVCRRRADNERDLLQHYKEDHPEVTR